MSEQVDTRSTNVTYDSSDAAANGNERHSLQTYVSDLLALVQHIEVPIERQRTIEDTSNYGEAIAIISQIKSMMATHRSALEAELTSLGGHPASGIKSAWSSILGVGAAAVNSVRKTKVSKALRDDYTALGLASISYTMLHATALGLGSQSVATLAERHLSEIAPVIIRISRAMPSVVLQELRDDGENVRISAAEMSEKTTQAAWSQNG